MLKIALRFPVTSTVSSFAALAALSGLAALAASGCGASTPPAETAHHEQREHERGGEHGRREHGGGEHHAMAGAAHEFHEVLAPLWHADKGPAREAKTCDAIPAFEQRGAAVVKEAPETAADARAAAQGLVAAVGELKIECAKPAGARPDFEAKLGAVHDAFHKVVEGKH